MSAYNASAPVTHSTTAPSTRNPPLPWWAKKLNPYQEWMAGDTGGGSTMLYTPIKPSAMNHTHITGPNTVPTPPVPRFWIRNSVTSTSTAIHTTQCVRAGAATPRPSTADSTVIDGVITPSPKNNAAPSTAASTTSLRVSGCWRVARCASAIIAMIPPSPLLSARMMKVTYFSATTISNVHSTSDSTPSTLNVVTGMPCWSLKASLKVYSGLVPRSPNTTPIAPSTMTRMALRLESSLCTGRVSVLFITDPAPRATPCG